MKLVTTSTLALLLGSAALIATAPASARPSLNVSAGPTLAAYNDNCDDYYEPPWGYPEDYCNYDLWDQPICYDGVWYSGPFYIDYDEDDVPMYWMYDDWVYADACRRPAVWGWGSPGFVFWQGWSHFHHHNWFWGGHTNWWFRHRVHPHWHWNHPWGHGHGHFGHGRGHGHGGGGHGGGGHGHGGGGHGGDGGGHGGGGHGGGGHGDGGGHGHGGGTAVTAAVAVDTAASGGHGHGHGRWRSWPRRWRRWRRRWWRPRTAWTAAVMAVPITGTATGTGMATVTTTIKPLRIA